jgi:6-phosphofructokinase 1
MTRIAIPTLGTPRFASPRLSVAMEERWLPEQVRWAAGELPAGLRLFEIAGPRPELFFEPARVKAGIVTCGGLCPGLNNVIRSLYFELRHGYGVPEVLGFRNGYGGLAPDSDAPPIQLTDELVDDIHREGGTILGTSRGPVNLDRAVENLMRLGVNVLFTIGGDGTQRGAKELFDIACRHGHTLAVVGIPKTIDNDVQGVERTFGFTTAVGAAREVLDSAHTEAHSVHNGVSLVKLMGRNAGFIAAAATVASQDVNFCLVPEVPFQLGGANGLLAALERRLARRRHALIVAAEGAGQDLIPGETGERDASGNVKFQDIGLFLRDAISAHCTARKLPITLRYFDPSYLVRSRPANTEDAVLCDRYARHAVHAALSGRTGLIIGYLHGSFVHVPIEMLTREGRRLDTNGELWRAVLAATGQPARLE